MDETERLAREWCKYHGLDPDKIIEWADQGMEGRREKMPQWHLYYWMKHNPRAKVMG